MARPMGAGGAAALLGTTAILLALTACRDSGLPGKNLPLDEARTKPFRYSVYDANADLPAAQVDGRTWRAAGPAESIPAGLLVPVEAGGGREMFALATDSPPRARLYMKTGDLYTPFAAVDAGRTGPEPGVGHD
jgi:hypothetical protein